MRAALIGQILGHESVRGDPDFVSVNENMAQRFDDTTPNVKLERILTAELLAYDKHRRRSICQDQPDVSCKDALASALAEDYATGYCFTMLKPTDCITTAARGAAYPASNSGGPEADKAVALARQAYR